jgi:hypothetical protein
MTRPVQLVTVAAVIASTAYSASIDVPHGSRLLQYRYVPGADPIDTNADIDLVGAKTAFVYINQDNIGTTAFQKLPRHATHDETGTASLYAAGGEPVEDKMAVMERLTFTVANGGADGKSGTFYFWFG